MIDITKVKTYSLKARKSKVSAGAFAKAPLKRASFRDFYDSLPDTLKARDLREVVKAVLEARRRKKAVILMMGAHVIKCGLNPVIIELMKKKVITCLCLNGAGVIHDFEIALQAKTSEDVAASLKNGSFGMARETADFINNAVKNGVSRGLGFGHAVASSMSETALPHKDLSVIQQAYKYGIPVCVFVAVGTDIIHQHPGFDAGLAGEGSLRDFHLLAGHIRSLHRGGVVLNFGSAVVLPEVFLKALNLCRNVGNKVSGFTTANFDMAYQYRPAQNVVARPVMTGGKGYYIIGHHEIMFPLLAQAITERL